MTDTALDIHEVRHELMATYINVMLALQIRAMRQTRGWTQKEFASKLGTSQSVVSGLEQLRWTNWPTITTLNRVAHVFDVGLIVQFVPWSQLFSEFVGSSKDSLNISGWKEEYELLSHAFDATPLVADATDAPSSEVPK